MSPSVPECSCDRQRIRAEAAAWIAKLHGPDRSCELEDGFRRWLAERPEHAEEFELATDVWNETAGIPYRVPHRSSAARPVRRRVGWSVAAGLAAAVLAVVWVTHWLGRSIVSTGVGQQKTVTLADGTRVTLNTDTRLIVRYSRSTRAVVLRYGEAYFQVVHNPAWPFVVQAGKQKVVDVGTSFMVRRNGVGPGSLSVTVIQGRVAVGPLDVADVLPKVPRPKVLLVSAGKRLLLRPNALPKIQIASAQEATAWLRGQLVFNNTALNDAAAEFNRYNTVQIIVAAPELDKIRVGGVFRTSASESFARSVAEANHLKLVTQGDALVLEPGGTPAGEGQTSSP